ncbi:MAG TPA: phosphodiester glycosidase family protein [Bacillota bacterium]|nr:phosphodiester glycosidase family protein [Bacillota bacterium]
MPRISRKRIAVAMMAFMVLSLKVPALAQFVGLANQAASYPAEGVEVRSVTELTKDGWLRYALIKVDTKAQGIYVGPFNADVWMDRPAGVLETLRSRDLIAAVNGDFFDTSTGMPLSMVVSDGVLIRSPRKDPDFSTLCIPAGGYGYIMDFQWSAKLVRQDGSFLEISSYNELSVGGSDAVLFNALRKDRRYPPNSAIALISANRVAAIGAADASGNPTAWDFAGVPFEFEVVATGKKASFIQGLKVGEAVRLEFNLFPPYPMQSAFSGKPVLLKGGVKTPNLSSYTSISGNVRAPRTMAGIDRSGMLYLVAVEGRSESSRGLTLDEAADLMLRLGCTDALNLDGGGSTQLAAADGAGSYRLIGSAGADRKVSYAVGVSAEKAVRKAPAPALVATPEWAAGFEIPAEGSMAEPKAAYLGIIGDIPVVTEGTALSLPGLTDIYDMMLEGPIKAAEDGSFIVTGPGQIAIRVSSREGSFAYRALASGKPHAVHLTELFMGEDGLSYSCAVTDSYGRQIPLPAAGIRAEAVGHYGTAEAQAALFPMERIIGIGRIREIAFYRGGERLSSYLVDIAVPAEGELLPEVTLNGMDRVYEWTAISAPEGALTAVRDASSEGRDAIELTYDFGRTGLRAAYLKPNAVIEIPAGYTELRIWANADLAGGHWLRANVRDQENRRHFLDFGRLEPGGWRQYDAALPEGAGALTLEQVYMVEFKDELTSSGKLLLDLITAADEAAAEPAAGLIRVDATVRSYKEATEADLPEHAARLLSEYKGCSEPASRRISLDCTGGSAFRNGIVQLQRLYEACTSSNGGGALMIVLEGLPGSPAAGNEPLSRIRDANERKLIESLAARAAFMGYGKVVVIEPGNGPLLAAESGGVLFMAVP